MSGGSTVKRLCEKQLVKNVPSFLPESIQMEVYMGSNAYGCSSDNSDYDVYGFVIPPKDLVFPHLQGVVPGFGFQGQGFEQWTQHHIKDNATEYDFTMYSIAKYFQLVMNNNPNMLDSLFVPIRCIMYSTPIGQLVRENRHLFLSKRVWHTFKGYAYQQCSKMKIKSPDITSNRYESFDKYGYDCYDEECTEFLTSRGWMRFDDVLPGEDLATFNMDSRNIEFQTPTNRIDKLYSGKLYEFNKYLSKFTVTDNHNLLVSSCHRSIITNFSTSYDDSLGAWSLKPLSELLGNSFRSFFHIFKSGNLKITDYDVEDSYLQLAGLFLSEGSCGFRNNKLKYISVYQTSKGKPEVYDLMRNLMSIYPFREYMYKTRGKYETVWMAHGDVANKVYNDFGHYSKIKRLPRWCFNMSSRQARILWDSMILGDGSRYRNGDTLYTSSKNLADDIQAMMGICGIQVSVRGPYLYPKLKSAYGICPMYQIYCPHTQKQVDFINLGRVVDHRDKVDKNTPSIRSIPVINRRVVCFEVPNGTLLTRNSGLMAIQGNCKYAYHIVRLMNEVEQILEEGDLDLERSREQLKSIRRGEWKVEQITDYFSRKEKDLEKLYQDSKLPYKCDEEAIKTLLVNCLEQHFGNISDCVKILDINEKALAEIKQVLEKYRL